MAEYLNVSELSRRSGIPRSTVRRWLKKFDFLLVSDLTIDDYGVERVVYHPYTLEVLRFIRAHRDCGVELDVIYAMVIREYTLCYYRVSDLYSDLSSRVNNATLWQRIFKKW